MIFLKHTENIIYFIKIFYILYENNSCFSKDICRNKILGIFSLLLLYLIYTVTIITDYAKPFSKLRHNC